MKIEQNYKTTAKFNNTPIKTAKSSKHIFADYITESNSSDIIHETNYNIHNQLNHSNKEEQSKKKCNQLLNLLKTIQINILQGNINQKNLLDLKHLIYIGNNPEYNELNDILEEIELRAAIELAKLE